ncbi:serum response factor protein A [Trifolium repens]|nr:serum response factor protein A [Trifolium repens]
MIIFNAFLSSNLTALSSGYATTDFSILKPFNVRIHLPKGPIITEIIWQLPHLHWVKCNSDGASKGNPGPPACGGIFRDNQPNDLGCFASNLGASDTFSAEFIGVIKAIEIAQRRG